MTNSSDRDANHRDEPRRRPYEPPVVEGTATFETLALTCGKITGDDTCARPYGGGYTNS